MPQKSVDSIQREYDRRVQEVMADLTRSESYRQEMAEKFYNDAREDILEEVQSRKQKLELDVRATRRIAFAAPEVPGAKDAATAMLAYRSALDRTERVDTQGELEELLQSAELVGDEYLSKACLVRGYSLGSSRVVGRYLEFRPEEMKKYEAFMDASEELNEHTKTEGLFGAASRLRKPEQYRA
jgi:hypothetical protein